MPASSCQEKERQVETHVLVPMIRLKFRHSKGRCARVDDLLLDT